MENQSNLTPHGYFSFLLSPFSFLLSSFSFLLSPFEMPFGVGEL